MEQKRMFKRILSLLVVATMLFSSFAILAVPAGAVYWSEGDYEIADNGNYSANHAWGYTFTIDDVNGKIGGEDGTIVTTEEAYRAANSNWAAHALLAPTGVANEYEVVKTLSYSGGADKGLEAGINFADGKICMLIHSSASYPVYAEDGVTVKYPNWEQKVACLALANTIGAKITLSGIDLEAGTCENGTATVEADPATANPFKGKLTIEVSSNDEIVGKTAEEAAALLTDGDWALDAEKWGGNTDGVLLIMNKNATQTGAYGQINLIYEFDDVTTAYNHIKLGLYSSVESMVGYPSEEDIFFSNDGENWVGGYSNDAIGYGETIPDAYATFEENATEPGTVIAELKIRNPQNYKFVKVELYFPKSPFTAANGYGTEGNPAKPRWEFFGLTEFEVSYVEPSSIITDFNPGAYWEARAGRNGAFGYTNADAYAVACDEFLTWWKHVAFAPVEGEENVYEVVGIRNYGDGIAFLDFPEGGFIWTAYCDAVAGKPGKDALDLFATMSVGDTYKFTGFDIAGEFVQKDATIEAWEAEEPEFVYPDGYTVVTGETGKWQSDEGDFDFGYKYEVVDEDLVVNVIVNDDLVDAGAEATTGNGKATNIRLWVNYGAAKWDRLYDGYIADGAAAIYSKDSAGTVGTEGTIALVDGVFTFVIPLAELAGGNDQFQFTICVSNTDAEGANNACLYAFCETFAWSAWDAENAHTIIIEKEPEDPVVEATNVALNKDYVVSGKGDYNASYYGNITDGIAEMYLGDNKNAEWFGFYHNGDRPNNAPDKLGYFIIDLENVYDVSAIKVGLIKQDSWGIPAPEYVKAYGSLDGETFEELGTFEYSFEGNNVGIWTEIATEAKAQYIKVEVKLAGTFAFVNEVEVYGVEAATEPEVGTEENPGIIDILPGMRGYMGEGYATLIGGAEYFWNVNIPVDGNINVQFYVIDSEWNNYSVQYSLNGGDLLDNFNWGNPGIDGLKAGDVVTLYCKVAEDAPAVDVTAMVSLDAVGSMSNPEVLTETGSVETVIGSNDWDGYTYQFVAPEAGEIEVSISDENTTGWIFSINNETTSVYGDMHYSDDDPLVTSEKVQVAKGDVIVISICTYGGMDTAGTVAWTLSFEEPKPEIVDILVSHVNAYNWGTFESMLISGDGKTVVDVIGQSPQWWIVYTVENIDGKYVATNFIKNSEECYQVKVPEGGFLFYVYSANSAYAAADNGALLDYTFVLENINLEGVTAIDTTLSSARVMKAYAPGVEIPEPEVKITSQVVNGFNVGHYSEGSEGANGAYIFTDAEVYAKGGFDWWRHVAFAPVEGKEGCYVVTGVTNGEGGQSGGLEIPEGGFIWVAFEWPEGGSGAYAHAVMNCISVGSYVQFTGIDIENCTTTEDATAEVYVEPNARENIALNKEYEISGIGVRDSYCANLTDGVAAGALTYNNNDWFGFYNNGANPTNAPDKVGFATVKLEKEYLLDSVRVNTFFGSTSGITSPEYIKLEVSTDGETFEEIEVKNFEATSTSSVAWVEFTLEETVKASYIRLSFKLVSTFVFINEIEAYGEEAAEEEPVSTVSPWGAGVEVMTDGYTGLGEIKGYEGNNDKIYGFGNSILDATAYEFVIAIDEAKFDGITLYALDYANGGVMLPDAVTFVVNGVEYVATITANENGIATIAAEFEAITASEITVKVAMGVSPYTFPIFNMFTELEVNEYVEPKPELPEGAIVLDYAGYVHDSYFEILAGDNMTVADLTALGYGSAKDMNYFYVVVVDANNVITETYFTLGRPDGVKSDVVCPEGGYIIGLNANKEGAGALLEAKVGDTIELYNIDVESFRGLEGSIALDGAGFVIVAAPVEEPVISGWGAGVEVMTDGYTGLGEITGYEGNNDKIYGFGNNLLVKAEYEFSIKFTEAKIDGIVLYALDYANGGVMLPDAVTFVVNGVEYVATITANEKGIATIAAEFEAITASEVTVKVVMGESPYTFPIFNMFTELEVNEYVEVTPDPVVKTGDVNGDDTVDKFDYILVKRQIMGTFTFDDAQNAAADVNGDGVVDKFDYILIKRHIMGTYVIGDNAE